MLEEEYQLGAHKTNARCLTYGRWIAYNKHCSGLVKVSTGDLQLEKRVVW